MAAGVQFYRLTSSQFSGIEKDSDALYFLIDTGEIFKGSARFSYPVKLLADSVFPAAGEPGVLYCTPAGAMKVWDGSAYVSLSGGGGSSAADNFLKAAVRHEATAEDVAAGGIYAGCEEGDTGILFTMEDGTRLFVKLSDLVDVYTATSGKGVALGISGHTVTAEARVSAVANNAVVLKDDGLYAEKYTLPAATGSSLGGVSVDTETTFLTVTGGVLSVDPVKVAPVLIDPHTHMSGALGRVVEGGIATPYLRVNHDASLDETIDSAGTVNLTVRKATASETGTVKPGTGLSVTSDGTLNAATASATAAGVVKVGTGLEIADGVLSVKQQTPTIEWKTV